MERKYKENGIPTPGGNPEESQTYPNCPNSVRVLLDPEQSEIIGDIGPCFAVVTPASWPDPPGRHALHLLPASVELIDKAVAVAKGELGTRKPPTR